MEYEIVRMDDELAHHGILGMKWGVRRYQRRDGTLTPAGRKRLARENEKLKKEAEVLKNRKATQAKIDRLEAKRKANEDLKRELDGDKEAAKRAKAETKVAKKADKKTGPKTIKDMTDEELAAAISRVRMEQTYAQLTYQPEKKNRAKEFVSDFLNKSAVPALQDAGKNLIRDSLLKAGKKYLNLEELDEMGALEKQADKLDLMNRIKKANKELSGKMSEEERLAKERKERADEAADTRNRKQILENKQKIAEMEAKAEAAANNTSSNNSKPKSENAPKVSRSKVEEIIEQIENVRVSGGNKLNSSQKAELDSLLDKLDATGFSDWYWGYMNQ